MQKPSLPKGTRDFGPAQMAKRAYILRTITKTFKKFGFQALETPAMENLSTLTGKYGDEGDQLLFKILNSGDFLKQVEASDLAEGPGHVLPKVAEKGLRYDLTVPFARYVVMNRNELAFPFKRYQVQPVWRADRPQRGRYREFYQCDADVVGTESLLCEVEIIAMIQEVFAELKIENYQLKINNRKVLTGIAEVIGAAGKESALCVAIDKLDKIGWEKVQEELAERGFSEEARTALAPLVAHTGDVAETLTFLSSYLAPSTIGMEGVAELRTVFSLLQTYGASPKGIVLDVMLARGLSYYTGAIFEVQVPDTGIGSVSGGGRYDNLTGVFGWEGVPGVGFSFGVDRLYDVLEVLQLFPEEAVEVSDYLLVHFDAKGFQYGLSLLAQLRAAGLAVELYPEPTKMKKQLAYATKKGIRRVLLLGDDEIAAGR
ncbi:histidyl-tRNA ligase [Nitritalea halalkaliphila LW7]|uniref:Histidine--tRNA ligase n=1 Tax=Nitritalea halalkaliphila LW7 TaxID=1189621 RepID=I5C9E7_9BACT|nr:histidine--tRNA ligase [Nitritalea halalkaliphila]EIM78449.1 histidyl-tRNA ligase [Nitritalea halalkaliphila LW7]